MKSLVVPQTSLLTMLLVLSYSDLCLFSGKQTSQQATNFLVLPMAQPNPGPSVALKEEEGFVFINPKPDLDEPIQTSVKMDTNEGGGAGRLVVSGSARLFGRRGMWGAQSGGSGKDG